MTDENIKTEDEPIEGFVREEQGEGETGADPTLEVIEGEVVEEELEEPLEEAPELLEDELTSLRQQLEEAQAQVDEYLDDLRRERAAFQNYRKRQENERAALRQLAVSDLLLQILPILDDFERALDAIPDDQCDKPWIEGIVLIQRKLQTALENVGVVPVEAESGQPFDPFVHEAVSYEEHDDYAEGEIIAVVQKGYQLGQRPLRPTMVRVAK